MAETLKYHADDNTSGKVVGLRLAFIVTRTNEEKKRTEGVVDTGLPFVKVAKPARPALDGKPARTAWTGLKLADGQTIRQPLDIGGGKGIRYIVAGWRTSFGWTSNAQQKADESDFD